MKIFNVQEVEQQSIGEFNEIQSSIRNEDLQFALEAVSKNLYSNPIGSFIRELVSNAVDANRETLTKKQVTVSIYREGGNWYFSVKDFGKGMNKEHFEQVYMKWFNSDKRDNNNAIGGWGIGSKTPLAYREDYEIETISEGVKRSYIIVKQAPAPTATLLEERETDEPSGTLIKFEIKEADLWTINKECRQQLAYFDEVIVTDEMYYYENVFSILNAEKFQYRPDKQPFSTLHIVIGQVPYKINYEVLGMRPINMPVAIKFDIGELPVTLSREDINYNHESMDVIGIIKDRIDEALKEIEDRYSSQVFFTDFKEYITYINSTDRYVKLGSHKLTLDTHYIKIKPSFEYKGYVYNYSKEVISNRIKELFKYGIIKRNKIDSYYIDSSLRILIHHENFVYINSESDHWSNRYYDGRITVRFKKITLKLLKSNSDNDQFLNRSSLARHLKPILPNRHYFTKEGIKRAYYFIKAVQESILTNLDRYDDVPYEYIKSIKDSEKEAAEARKGSLTAYTVMGSMVSHNIEDLCALHDYIFYINRKDDIVKSAHYLAVYDTLPDYFKKKLKVVIINPSSIKTVKRIDIFKPIEDLFKYKKLRNYFNRLRIGAKVSSFHITHDNFSTISPYYTDVYKKLKNRYPYVPNTVGIYDIIEKKYVQVDVNISEYFKDTFEKLKNNKVYLYEEHVEELEKAKDFINTAIIIRSKVSEFSSEMKYLIKNSKLLKITRHGKEAN